MKIFLSFLQSPIKHPIPAYDFWQYYIKNGIEEAGHEWDEHPDVDWALGLVPQSKNDLSNWKDTAWSKTIKRLKEQPADLFLSYLYPQQINKSAIQEIQKMGIPCVNFFCDNVRQFNTIPSDFNVFNLNWVPEYKAIKLYKKARYPVINLPMPMWIKPELRTMRSERNKQLTFIGSKDIQRLLFFEDVVNKAPNINLNIYGNGWKTDDAQQMTPVPAYTTAKKIAHQLDFLKQQGIISYARKLAQRNVDLSISDVLKTKVQGLIDFDTYNKLTAESMITIGINRYPSFRFPLDKPATYSRLRDIEAPMLGACYLTENTEGLDQLYEIGKEIAVYNNPDDFADKVSELSSNIMLRNGLRKNGQQRALSDHSIPRSINKILQRLK